MKRTKKMDKCTKKMDKMMELIYENPKKNMTVRGIARKTGLSKSTVQKRMKELEKEDILNNKRLFSNSIYAKFAKTQYYLGKLYKSGLVDFLIMTSKPSSIVLFGSFAKGESVSESDIDIFLETKKKNIDLLKYEKKLNHKIQLFIEPDIKKLPDELFNNVVNGIKLYGFFDAR